MFVIYKNIFALDWIMEMIELANHGICCLFIFYLSELISVGYDLW